MLCVTFGERRPGDGGMYRYFNTIMKPEWFDDPLVKDMVLEIDKSVVHSASQIDSPVLGCIDSSRLSAGVKTLITLYKLPEENPWGNSMGDNCYNAMFRLASMMDTCVYFTNILIYDQITESVHAYFPQTDTEVFTLHDFRVQMMDLHMKYPGYRSPYNDRSLGIYDW